MEFSEQIAIFSLALTLVSIIVNVLIVYLNNKHKERIRKLENTHELFKLDTLHKRKLYESFLDSVGMYQVYFRASGEREYFSQSELKDIFEKYVLILPYIPEEIVPHFEIFLDHINHQNTANLKIIEENFYNHIIPFIREDVKIKSKH